MSNDEANSADIYVSNFTAGVGIPPPYLFASPHMARVDLGITFVQDLGSASVDLMPIAQTTLAEIIIGHYYTVRNWDTDPLHYGMIYVSAVDANDNGRVDVRTWTSSLPGSRIIGLISDPDPPPP